MNRGRMSKQGCCGVEADTHTAEMRGVAASGRQRVRMTVRRESAWPRLLQHHHWMVRAGVATGQQPCLLMSLAEEPTHV